jgi:tetratricopeptide (TPR) repeat protein
MWDDREELDGIHGPGVSELAGAGDWAGLCRYWVAHQYKPALDRAVEITGRLGGARGAALTQFLGDVRRNPYDGLRCPPDFDPAENTHAENVTLDILRGLPYVALCEVATEFTIDFQAQALNLGILFAEKVVGRATAVNDAALVAFISAHFLAAGLWADSKPERAVRAAEAAVDIYRELAKVRPDAYRRELAMTLNTLGNARRGMGNPAGAAEAYREAEGVCRQLVAERPDAHRADLAMTLTNLGTALRDLGALAEAVQVYREAVDIRTELAKVRPDVRPRLAMSLNNLGVVLTFLGEPEEAVPRLPPGVRPGPAGPGGVVCRDAGPPSDR